MFSIEHFLLNRSYVEGWRPTQADAWLSLYLATQPSHSDLTNIPRYHRHISSFTAQEKQHWPTSTKYASLEQILQTIQQVYATPDTEDKLFKCTDAQAYIEQYGCPAQGLHYTINIWHTNQHHLDEEFVMSDMAMFKIPALSLEEPAGTGTYTTLRQYLNQTLDKLEEATGRLSGKAKQRMIEVTGELQEMLDGSKEFAIEIIDPSGLTMFLFSLNNPNENEEDDHDDSPGEGHQWLICEPYDRTWEENEELNLLPDNIPSSSVEDLCQLISQCKKCVVYTGAGVSTDVGIPDFRSAGGVWTRYNLADFTYDKLMNSEEALKDYWKMKREVMAVFAKAHPGRTHSFVKHLHDAGKLLSCITTNVDGLHLAAGVPRDKIVRLHGTSSLVDCIKCKKIHPPSVLIGQDDRAIPLCPSCTDGYLKFCSIAYGQKLDEDVLAQALDFVQEADLLLVMGTSLKVAPANRFPGMARNRGTPVAIVNLTSTFFDAHAQVCIHDKSSDILAQVLQSKLSTWATS
eukprot:m.89059 g.89059  ORF g.89059 m.89059 type:complete len:516 (-) comp21494_c0_seq1:53-1600(-)